MFPLCNQPFNMDCYLTEQQVEELVNFDCVEQDLADLVEDGPKFNLDEYLNSDIDYWWNFKENHFVGAHQLVVNSDEKHKN